MADTPTETKAVLEWTDSKVELAALILQQGFAVLSVDEDTTRIFQQAAQLARAFFLESNINESNKSYQRLSTNGHLMGYNEPSPAKLLFRAFFDKENDHQLWPNASLQNASDIAAQALHDILTDCHSEIHQILLRQSNANPDKEDNQCFSRASCPLDYFYYHGRGEPGLVANCSPHTDRGVLIAVALSNVPGLEVLLRDPSNPPSFSCYCPEQVHADRLFAQPYSLVCVMAGDHLHRLHRGCIHRVRDNLPSPRLSISYEIRL